MIKKKDKEVEKKQAASDLPWPDLASELATTGDIEGLQQLLEATEDKKFNNKLDRRGKNAFIIACEEGRVEMIKMLLAYRPNINYKMKNKNTALMQAAVQGEFETVDLLIDIGAAIDTAGEDNETALHVVCKHNRHGGFLKVLDSLLSKIDDDLVDVVSAKQETPLTIAIKMDFREHALRLLARGANINHQGINLNTPVIRCAFDGRLDMLEFLVAQKANLSLRNFNDETALIVATKRNLRDIISFLLANGESVNEKDATGKTALMWLCMICTDLSLVEYFVNELNADINLCDNWGYTALMFAVKSTSKNNFAAMKFLLEKGSYINNVDKSYCSCLIYAAKRKKIPECKLLLDNGADPECTNFDGKNALDYLKKKDKTQIMEYITNIRILGVAVKPHDNPTKPRWVNHLLENKGFVPWTEEERRNEDDENEEKVNIIDL